ncbi:hypothetical protein Pelo_12238 [Pelomyxa schiedti]|nr:hypothetical protein Pelo_12238 [Pelomyxa schiedti]
MSGVVLVTGVSFASAVIVGCLLLGAVGVAGDTCMGTIYAADALRWGVSLSSGVDGTFYSGYETYNRGVDVGLLGNDPTFLVVAAQESGRVGKCVDIGTMEQIASNYSFSNFGAPVATAYTSIHWSHDELVIAASYNNSTAEFQPLSNATSNYLFSDPEPNYRCLAVVGHVVLVNIEGEDYHLIAKLLILEIGTATLTLRWDVLYDKKDTLSSAPCHCLSEEPYTHGNNILGEMGSSLWAEGLSVVIAVLSTVLAVAVLNLCIRLHYITQQNLINKHQHKNL